MLKLREIRLEKGLSVPELSRRSGVSRRTIEDIEAVAPAASPQPACYATPWKFLWTTFSPANKQNSQHKSRLVSRPGGFCAK